MERKEKLKKYKIKKKQAGVTMKRKLIWKANLDRYAKTESLDEIKIGDANKKTSNMNPGMEHKVMKEILSTREAQNTLIK